MLGASNRDRLCGIIDTILAEQPKDFEVFLQKLIQQGYEVKRGKHTAAKGKEQKISSADELRERATAATERYHAMGDSIKAAETRLAEIAVPRFASWYPPSIWKVLIPTWVYSCCVRHEENRSENCRIVFPQMGVSRMGYGYFNIIYGQIRQKSLIFFVYL